MKQTSLVFAAAVALLMVGLASRQAPQPPDASRTLALDFQGIDSLRVDSDDSVAIRLSSSKPQVSYAIKDDSVVTTRREGSMLVLKVRSVGYPDPEITVPSTLRLIETAGAGIEAVVAPASLLIKSRGTLAWTGNANSLRIEAQRAEDDCTHVHCPSDVTVGSGIIDDLTVSLPIGDVRLQGSSPGRTTLLLGPEATFSVVRTRRIGDISILPYADATAAEAPVPEPTKIAQ